MSDDFEDKPAETPAAKVPRKRPAARKAGKPKSAAPAGGSDSDASAAAAPAEPARAVPASEESSPRRSQEAREPRGATGDDSAPEAIPFFVENNAAEPPGNSKKRRRRKKKHGQSQGQQHPHAVAPPADALTSSPEPVAPAPVMHAAPRPKLDPEEVSKKAWKIFQSEVGEEGLALIDDHDAREISRRCFRLAEIFLEEAARRSR